MKKRIYLIFSMVVFLFSMQSCFLFEPAVSETEKPKPKPVEKPELGIGSKVGNMTIVWVNKSGDSWKFLAMGTPSDPMQWANTDSTYLSASSMSTAMGMGKENTSYLLSQFNSQAHSAMNNAALYCRKKGGWLPSRDEAKEVAKFVSKNFWVSNCEPTSKAFYFDAVRENVNSTFRTERKTVVTIPIYYLDSNGRIVKPY